MMRRLHPVVCGLLAGLAAAALCQGQQAPRILTDPGNDAVTRRTDLGNAEEIVASTAVWSLVAGRDDAIAFLVKNVRLSDRKAVTPLDEAKVKPWIASHVPVGRLGRPLDMKAAVLFLASKEAEYVNGATVHVDGGWSAQI